MNRNKKNILISDKKKYFLDYFDKPIFCYSTKTILSNGKKSMRARRSNDSIEQDINLIFGDLDTNTLAAFTTINSSYVSGLYNQLNNGDTLNIISSVATKQPRIVNSGILDNGIYFDGSNFFLRTDLQPLNFDSEWTMIIHMTGSSRISIFETIFSNIPHNAAGNGFRLSCGANDGTIKFRYYNGTGETSITLTSSANSLLRDNNEHVLQLSYKQNGNLILNIDGVGIYSSAFTPTRTLVSTSGFTLCANTTDYSTAASWMQCNLKSAILFPYQLSLPEMQLINHKLRGN